MSVLKTKREERARLAATVTDLLKQKQTAETRAKIDSNLNVIEDLTADITRIERADKAQAAIMGQQGEAIGEPESAKSYRSAWVDYLTHGTPGNKWSKRGGCDERSHTLLTETRSTINAAPVEKRAQIAGAQSITYTEGAVGGYFVPAGFVQDVDVATKYFAPLVDGSVVRILETASGQVLPYPTSNDTNQAWTLVGESTQVADKGSAANYPNAGTAPSDQPGNVALNHINFNAYKGTTGLIRVSLELLQDSAFDIENFLKEAFASRLGRGYEYYLTNGSGVGQPFGILPAIAASGATPVTAIGSAANDGDTGNTSANSVGYNDLVNLEHSVDPTYRRDAKFMFADTTLRHLKTRLDKFGRPIWVPGVKEGEPDTILGYRYVINQSFPTIAASKTVAAFGDFKKFIVRKVRDLQVIRLDERFADYGEVAFIGFSRIDSNLVDAGTNPINALQMHS